MKEIDALKTLKGWRWYVWLFWGDRIYVKNADDNTWDVFLFASYLMLATCVVAFKYCPWTMVNIMMTFGVVGMIFTESIKQANRQYQGQLFGVLFGSVCCYHQIDLGMTVLYWPIEPLVYAVITTGGALGLLRRIFNELIWCAVDGVKAELKESGHE